MNRYLKLGMFVVVLLTLGCGGGLKMTKINSDQKKPNNVWVFFTVEDGEEPVSGLEAKDFKIYEDDGLVSIYESKQTIQNPEVAAVMYTMLLLDVSGSMVESGHLDPLVESAKVFTEQVGKTQKVGVYAFDGSKKLHSVVPFTDRQGSVQGGLDGLKKWWPKDESTNLNGGVVEGIQTLRKALDKEEKPLKFGTLVVFSDGADRAARVTREDMLKELDKEEYKDFDIFAIGMGDKAEMEDAQLEDIGRDGTVIGSDPVEVEKAFQKVASRIEKHTKRFYLLSYCTPARNGDHKVRIEVELEEGGSGSLEYTFNADGFGPPPQCDPERKPKFDLKDVEPPPEEDQ